MNNFTQPVEELGRSAREYVDLRVDDLKLRTAKGLSLSVSKILSMILILGVVSVLLLSLAFALVMLIGEALGSYGWGAMIVAGVLLVVLVVLVALKDRLFRDSFVRLFVKLFFGPDDEKL